MILMHAIELAHCTVVNSAIIVFDCAPSSCLNKGCLKGELKREQKIDLPTAASLPK